MTKKQLNIIKKYLLLYSFYFIFFSSCQNDEICNCTIDKNSLKRNDSIFTLVENYWKKTDFWKNNNEPLLDTLKNETYRVYLYSLFDEVVKIHRIEKNSNGYQLTIKQYHSKEAFQGKQDSLPFKEIIRPLSKMKWNEIVAKMNEYCFWTMDSQMSSRGCLDESPLILEGNNPQIKCSNIKPYHVIVGSCVDSLKGYKYFQLCDMLLDLDKEK
jgi:hypothetical protein